jgi:tRNA U34 2-thiouridine synthase MnmA/TrmU
VDGRHGLIAHHPGVQSRRVVRPVQKGVVVALELIRTELLAFQEAQRRYILDIVPSRNEVVVGERDDLLASGLLASRTNWLIEPPECTIAAERTRDPLIENRYGQ